MLGKLTVLLLVYVTIFRRATGICIDGGIRLVNGGNQYEGRVEICLNNQWGTVCDDYWKSNPHNARVACRQLGYSDIGAQTRASDPNRFLPPPFGRGTGLIFLDDVQCTGTEQRLQDCPHFSTPTGSEDCIHDEDVGVTCQPPIETSAAADTTTTTTISESIATSTGSTRPMGRPDNGVAFVPITTQQDSQEEVVKTTVNPEQRSSTSGSTTSLSDHHHTASNSPVDVTSFIKSRFPNVILVTVIVAVILLAAISTVILLLVVVLIRKARLRGEKATNYYEDPNTLEPPGDERERELILIINNCSLPGNGKVAENVCYEWTTFQQVQNIAYGRVGQASTRADENHHYETINDITAAARSNRDYYNTRLATTTPL